ncbi:MAG: phospholipase D-like domain-containing protein [Candidatus Acidiferrales bacterium]
MPFTITTTVTCYLLPQDGATAKANFLQHLLDPGETWIIAYAFTLTDMISDLIAAHKAGLPLHLYLDHSQEVGKVEKPLVQQLVGAGIEVTIGTSPAGSQYICHTKGMASDPAANGGALWCWEGSTNFSLSAWSQVNTALVFASQQWRDEFVAQFEALVDFAWANERSMQVMSAPPPDLGKAPAASRVRYGLTPTPDPGAVAGHATPKPKPKPKPKPAKRRRS